MLKHSDETPNYLSVEFPLRQSLAVLAAQCGSPVIFSHNMLDSWLFLASLWPLGDGELGTGALSPVLKLVLLGAGGGGGVTEVIPPSSFQNGKTRNMCLHRPAGALPENRTPGRELWPHGWR